MYRRCVPFEPGGRHGHRLRRHPRGLNPGLASRPGASSGVRLAILVSQTRFGELFRSSRPQIPRRVRPASRRRPIDMSKLAREAGEDWRRTRFRSTLWVLGRCLETTDSRGACEAFNSYLPERAEAKDSEPFALCRYSALQRSTGWACTLRLISQGSRSRHRIN